MTLQAPGATELDAPTRDALGELLLSIADDEFVLGFWDSEWTGIAPMLEEDVAFSSIAQDEIGHARALYELLAQVTGRDADEIAFGRPASDYRHARLLNHARGDWAFSIARRWLYDTADAERLRALADSSYRPLAELVAKLRREETYHLMHLDAWMRRLAADRGEGRSRLEAALDRLWPDAVTVFATLPGEDRLVAAGVLPEPMAALRDRWLARIGPTLTDLDLCGPPAEAMTAPVGADGRRERTDDFHWLWGEFTAVRNLEAGATW